MTNDETKKIKDESYKDSQQTLIMVTKSDRFIISGEMNTKVISKAYNWPHRTRTCESNKEFLLSLRF